MAFRFGRDIRGADAGPVVLVGHPGEHAGVAPAQRQRVDAGVFQGLPGRLEHQALLRVHRGGLARADAEEARVEIGHTVEETAFPRVDRPGDVRIGIEQSLEVPAAVGGIPADGVHALGGDAPQVLGGPDAAGVSAGHPDDGDGLPRPIGEFAQVLFGLVEFFRGLLQIAA
ncbi:hypothetical protein IFM12276_36000 [Nocardia sputorum]|uniref:Uncharacterized protein n=1 Tax=Nocardia sputorum TaxID=2984338 RepID=A0ABM8CZR9_9NOCA|nr:hypothetical protein IFM12276_36000 [Nocardia sputorum]